MAVATGSPGRPQCQQAASSSHSLGGLLCYWPYQRMPLAGVGSARFSRCVQMRGAVEGNQRCCQHRTTSSEGRRAFPAPVRQ